MAGSYPNAPHRRIAWDSDGTVVQRGAFGSGVDVPLADKQVLNREDNTSYNRLSYGSGGMLWIWPEHRDIYGYMHGRVGTITNIEYSTGTTNGVDGTWVQFISNQSGSGTDIYPEKWRTTIISSFLTSALGVRAVRLSQSGGISDATSAHHWYGEIAAGSTPDRLLFIDNNTGLEFDGPLDWGDVPRGTTLEYDIRLKNNSTTLTAGDIDLDFEALYQTADTWHSINDSGGAFGGTLNITSIAPGATYPAADVLTIQLVVAADPSLSTNASRLFAFTNLWT